MDMTAPDQMQLFKREMTTHLMGLFDITKLRFIGRITADGWIAPGFIYRAAWGETATGVRALKIKHPPATILFFSDDPLGFLALFFQQ